MPSFLVLKFISSSSRRWQGVMVDFFFLYGGSVEDEGDIGVSNFLGITIWRLDFSNGDIKAEMMSPP
jgi:hypothetical protein